MSPYARPFALLAAVATLAACGDSTGPDARLEPAEIIAQCVAGTITTVATDQVRSGAIDGEDDDCRTVDLAPEEENVFGRIEVWEVPQTAFGDADAIGIELAADFDGVLFVFDEEGNVLDWSDTDIGGDLGSEFFLLTPGLDPEAGDYFVGVLSYGGEPDGEYSIAFSAEPLV